MKLVKTTNIWRSVFALAIMLCASAGYSQDLAQAKQLCGNLTAANKAMAQQAGYDLDALCGEVSAAGADKRVIEPEPMVPRNTASSRGNDDPYGQQDPYTVSAIFMVSKTLALSQGSRLTLRKKT